MRYNKTKDRYYIESKTKRTGVEGRILGSEAYRRYKEIRRICRKKWTQFLGIW